MARPKDPYKGTILGKPLELFCAPRIHSERPPDDADPDVWRHIISSLKKADARKHMFAFLELYDHFKINRFAPKADLELILSLAWRHEKNLFDDNGRARITELYELYGADPESDGELCLALKIASKHIPAFQAMKYLSDEHLKKARNEGPGAPSNLDHFGIFTLLSLIGLFKEEHRKKFNQKPSDRQIAQYITDPVKAAELIGKTQADIELSRLSGQGNKDRNIHRDLSERAIRGYLKEIRNLVSDLKKSKGSKFQYQLFNTVLPIIFKDGQ